MGALLGAAGFRLDVLEDTWTCQEITCSLVTDHRKQLLVRTSDEGNLSQLTWSDFAAVFFRRGNLWWVADDLRQLVAGNSVYNQLDELVPAEALETLRSLLQDGVEAPSLPQGPAEDLPVSLVPATELESPAAYLLAADLALTHGRTGKADTAPTASTSGVPSITSGECPVLDQVLTSITQLLDLEQWRGLPVLVLWIAHTYLIDKFETTPRLCASPATAASSACSRPRSARRSASSGGSAAADRATTCAIRSLSASDSMPPPAVPPAGPAHVAHAAPRRTSWSAGAGFGRRGR